jgi:hypothetical protein
MRPIACVLLLFASYIPSLSAQSGDEAEELRRRVSDLEKKVELLERTLTALLPRQTDEAPAPQQITHPSRKQPPFAMPPELVPEIGKIGAEVGVLASGSGNPFDLNRGKFAAAFIDLPLFDRPEWLHGKVSYEILVGMSQSNTPMKVTSNVAQVANLSVLNTLFPNGGISNVTYAVTGTGPAPFPVNYSVNTRLRLLQVVPFSLKYTTSVLERWRLRPYALFGFGTYVTIHTQYPQGTAALGVRQDASLPAPILAAVNQIFGGQAPFGGPLIAGQIAQSPELEARGLPSGHGSLDLGIQAGTGLEFRLNRTISLGFDARFNRIAGAPGLLTTYGSRVAWHF